MPVISSQRALTAWMTFIIYKRQGILIEPGETMPLQTERALHKKNPSKLYWGLVLANTTSMIGVLRGKICCDSGDPNGAHLHHAFHRLNHIAVYTVAAELVDFGF